MSKTAVGVNALSLTFLLWAVAVLASLPSLAIYWALSPVIFSCSSPPHPHDIDWSIGGILPWFPFNTSGCHFDICSACLEVKGNQPAFHPILLLRPSLWEALTLLQPSRTFVSACHIPFGERGKTSTLHTIMNFKGWKLHHLIDSVFTECAAFIVSLKLIERYL